MSHIPTVSLLVVILGSVNCWVINNVDIPLLKKQFELDVADYGNEISPEEFAQYRFSLIYPGTKWCGAGSIAENYDDLGPEKATDMCCRDHDYCPDFIEAGETRHNLTNEAFYTRLSCECDEQFRKCLRETNRRTANSIGTVYFNALATKCFRKDYPTLKCVKRGGWLNRKCLKYTYDTSAKKLYQWFDVNNY